MSSSPTSTRPVQAPISTGLSLRVVFLSLFLAALFGFCIPIVDFKMSNTFLGAMHMPAGAIAVLLVLLLVANPLLGLISKRARFSRPETLTVYITCLFSALVPGLRVGKLLYSQHPEFVLLRHAWKQMAGFSFALFAALDGARRA